MPPGVFLPPIELIVELFRASPAGTFDLGAELDQLHDEEFRRRAPEPCIAGTDPGSSSAASSRQLVMVSFVISDRRFEPNRFFRC